MFDPVVYMKSLKLSLKLTKDNYRFTTVSGVTALEDIITKDQKEKRFFAVDDSQDGKTFRGAGGGFFERRQYTVFVLRKVAFNDPSGRLSALEEAKTIYRKILARMIKDKNLISFIDLSEIPFYEVPPAFATGCSGIYFMFRVNNPIDLLYDGSDWI